MSKKISELVAGSPVVASLESDEYETTQGGVSKGALGSQIAKVPTLHTNVSTVTVLSPDGEQTLLDAPASRALAAGNVIDITAFGNFLDPGINNPAVQINLKINGSIVASLVLSISSGGWYLHATMTIQTAGVAGHVTGSIFLITGAGTIGMVSGGSVAVIDTTGTPTIDVTSATDNISGTEGVECDQLILRKIY